MFSDVRGKKGERTVRCQRQIACFQIYFHLSLSTGLHLSLFSFFSTTDRSFLNKVVCSSLEKDIYNHFCTSLFLCFIFTRIKISKIIPCNGPIKTIRQLSLDFLKLLVNALDTQYMLSNTTLFNNKEYYFLRVE